VSDVVPALDYWDDESSCFVREPEEVVQIAAKYPQFDWGDFFLFPTAEAASSAIRESPSTNESWYPFWVLRSLAVIRCVDDTYFYFYGTDHVLRDWVIKTLRPMEFKEGAVSELDFPR
jgi:hypothetical protein